MDAKKNKITFKTVDVDGKEISLDVRKPTTKTQMEADKVYNKVLIERLSSKEKNSVPRDKVQEFIKENNLWDDNKQKALDEIDAEILKGETAIKSGGITKSACRALAIKLRKDRNIRSSLMATTNMYDELSHESQAENRKFDCWVALSTLDSETGDPYFKSLEDYDNRKEEKAAVDAAINLAYLAHGLDPDYFKKLPENKFLKDYGFCDDEYRLIDSQGRLCDEDYRLVNEEGYYINDNKEIVNKDGQRIEKDGSLVVEFTEFLDD